jgi:Putative amidoligase enzyme
MRNSLHEAIRFSAQHFASVLNDPNIKVGYEIEFIAHSPSLSGGMKKQERAKAQTQILQQVAQGFGDLGIHVLVHPRGKNLDAWSMVGDSSIEPDHPDSELGLELVSPPMPVAEAVDKLHMVFEYMTQKGYYTNETTGFHVGVSYESAATTKKADPLKLILLLGEPYVMKMFERETNSYAMSHLSQLVKDVAAAMRRDQTSFAPGTPVQELLSAVRKKLTREKRYSVNLLKQAQHGYFEFRIMGNRDYHKRWQQVKTNILRYGFVLRAALDPQAYKREYLRELGSLVVQAASDRAHLANITTPEDTVKRYVLSIYRPSNRDHVWQQLHDASTRDAAILSWYRDAAETQHHFTPPQFAVRVRAMRTWLHSQSLTPQQWLAAHERERGQLGFATRQKILPLINME